MSEGVYKFHTLTQNNQEPLVFIKEDNKRIELYTDNTEKENGTKCTKQKNKRGCKPLP